jgi:hypothetical protein
MQNAGADCFHPQQGITSRTRRQSQRADRSRRVQSYVKSTGNNRLWFGLLHAARPLRSWLISDVRPENMCNSPEDPPDDKLTAHLLSLWMHQNTILWGRIQLISAIQAVVVGGWYTLFTADKFRYAALLTLLGTALSLAVFAVIDCDLDWRRDIKKRLENLDSRIFPQKIPAVSGWFVIRSIAIGFFWLNVALFCVTLISKATMAGWIKSLWMKGLA